MLGLLYKDFVAVKGKRFVLIYGIIFCILLLIRVFLDAQTSSMILTGLLLYLIIMMYGMMIGMIELSLMKTDSKMKQKLYYLSMPVSKKMYVAEKYIFMLIAYYGINAYLTLVGMLCAREVNNETIIQLIMSAQTITGMLPAIFCMFIVMSSVELPFFFGLGANKGNVIRQATVILLFFGVIVYFLFGDLTIIDKIDVVSISKYLAKHPEIMIYVNCLTPVITMPIYYASYRLSVYLFCRKEWEADE